MNDAALSDDRPASPEEMMAAMFASMVIQQTNMAMMMLGKVPHPETGETFLDLDSARMFIDQIEMLAVKTKGNLDKREEHLLKQSLTALHMTFVEVMDAQTAAPGPQPAQPASAATETPPAPAESKVPEPAQHAPPPSPAPAPAAAPTPAPAVAEEESRKRFSKKY